MSKSFSNDSEEEQVLISKQTVTFIKKKLISLGVAFQKDAKKPHLVKLLQDKVGSLYVDPKVAKLPAPEGWARDVDHSKFIADADTGIRKAGTILMENLPESIRKKILNKSVTELDIFSLFCGTEEIASLEKSMNDRNSITEHKERLQQKKEDVEARRKMKEDGEEGEISIARCKQAWKARKDKRSLPTWEVERILDEKNSYNEEHERIKYYYIKWKGSDELTWEPVIYLTF